MIALAQATNNATREDTRRITEDDPDYQQLHATTVARLQRSVRQYAREVKRGDPGADTRFINRHIGLMRQAYEAAHHAGQKDYWPSVSQRTVQHRYIAADPEQTNKRLTYYALGSVLKMAHEVKSYVLHPPAQQLSDTIKLYNPNHDSKGRFTYGSGAATKVTRGQGRTRRVAGGKRVRNENYKGGKLGAFAKPGSTGGASSEQVQRLLAPSVVHSDYQENRRAVANDLAARMKGNADFQAMAAEAGVSPEEMSYRMVDSFFSNRSSGALDASQLAARDQFGLTDTSHSFDTSAAKAQEMYNAHPEAYRGFVQAQYDSTQEMFAREGITSITAYRGIGQNDTKLPSTAKLDGGNHEIDITMRPLSSWSVRDTLSSGFARNYKGQGMLMKADIPVTRILSTPITGWGVEDQSEIVVLGGWQHVSYRGFSGWDDRYEGFQR